MRYNRSMKKLNTFWNSFQKSLLDFNYYRDIIKASFWFSFKYLFFLLICLSFIRSVQLGIQYSKIRNKIPSYITMGKKELTSLYPKELELRISNGKLYTNVVEPYVIEFPKVFGNMDGKHLAVIDTKGIADNYPKYNALILATRQALVYPDKQQGNAISTKMYYFSELKRSLYIDHALYSKMVQRADPLIKKLPKIIDTFVIIGLLLLPFFGGLFWLSGTLFGLIFLTILVWIMEKIAKTSFGYKTLFRLGMHGVTWSILFSFMLGITNQSVPYLYNLIFIVWMGFVLFKNK
ncbi:hypothetical protein COZ40_01035 [Candidatus Roizmanbacteria bacterium CG_4_10_14_3_um_filter_39_13]|uniref:DUF1189 domain-containing protein n=3 Tax=Candidatus Roizmaniibacteriota TaxID=1752723 RepID=A0A2M7LLB0_9BACT|nr:MAG: hypothetical protein COS52_02155 [Candidatus Roizmanbacteria bacterium CG03_land_8_20_14_0_80_39_12]PIX68861.1 MAG: hypothetical protein COZ40_01035 [Candidatus Roizmanbacteria bacterium CG_4_10_14_3_um_filter_39_13]